MNHLFICRLIFILPVVVQCRAHVAVQNATVQLNKPASLRCTLQSSHEVLIVTWQKIKLEVPENMVTYSKNYGVKLQPSYRDKVNITQLELRNSTITFWNTTREDDGCYNCLFNTFGSGRFSGRACLVTIAGVDHPNGTTSDGVLSFKGPGSQVGRQFISLLLSIVSLIILLVACLISILYWKCHRHQEVGPEILALSSMDVHIHAQALLK
ncbi:CD200-like protein [Betacoronavirus Erinaceus]|nr:CD200-like protein [Betacoronavirus Erinaceus]QRN68120.1 CD200-like protein [Betacoronavirus Erinaceus]